MPLNGVSGANGTLMAVSHLTSSGCSSVDRWSKAKSHRPSSDHHRGRRSNGRGCPIAVSPEIAFASSATVVLRFLITTCAGASGEAPAGQFDAVVGDGDDGATDATAGEAGAEDARGRCEGCHQFVHSPRGHLVVVPQAGVALGHQPVDLGVVM